jgi:thymidine phosphorylase
VETPIAALSDGYISKIDAGAVGELVLDFGGGRRRKDDTVDLQVGVIVHKTVGEAVAKGETVLTLRSRDALGTTQVDARARSIIDINTAQGEIRPLFL